MLMLCRVFATLRSHTQSSLYRTVRQASPETLPLLFAAIATEANEYGFTDDLVKLRTRKSQTAGLNSAIRTLKSKLEQVKPNSITCVCMCVVQTTACSHRVNTQYTGDRLADTVAARSSTAAVAQDATVAHRQAELEQLAAMQAAKHHEVLPSRGPAQQARQPRGTRSPVPLCHCVSSWACTSWLRLARPPTKWRLTCASACRL